MPPKKLFLLIFTFPFFDAASAQIVQPIPKKLIQSPSNKVEAFSMGYGAGVANYMCFESLKTKLSIAGGSEVLKNYEILNNYKRWINQQQTVSFNHFRQGFNSEVQQFNQAYTNSPCPFSF